MDYFASKFPNRQLEAPPPDTCLDSLARKCAWQFWGKMKLYFMFSDSAPHHVQNGSRATEEADLYQRYKKFSI